MSEKESFTSNRGTIEFDSRPGTGSMSAGVAMVTCLTCGVLLQLLLHVSAAALPSELGGSLDYDHPSWLARCHQVADTQVRTSSHLELATGLSLTGVKHSE